MSKKTNKQVVGRPFASYGPDARKHVAFESVAGAGRVSMVVTFASTGMDLSHARGILEVAQALYQRTKDEALTYNLLAQLYINESRSNARFQAVA